MAEDVPIPAYEDDGLPVFQEENHPVTKADIYRSLQANEGNISKVARDLNRRRATIKSIIDRTPELKALVDDLREGMIDHSEENIFADVKRGDSAASRLVVQTLGKDRGWTSGVAGSGKDGALVVEIRQFADKE